MPRKRKAATLSNQALNRALLSRQMLLRRGSMPVAAAVDHLTGMQAQEPQAPYIGLWSRVEGFVPDELSELLLTRRAVRGTLMRGTLHLVTAEDWTRLRATVAPVLERSFKSSPFAKALEGVKVEQVLSYARRLLADQPLSRAELAPLLAARWPNVDPTSLAYAVSYLEPLVQVPPRGLWRQVGQARWMGAEAWLGHRTTHRARPDELITRYLSAFGPATVLDIQAWSGLTRLDEAVDGLRDRLRIYRDERGHELLDVPDGPLPDRDTPVPPRFLPPFDNIILAHADRGRIVTPADRAKINKDRLMRTFLIDGFVAGTWQLRDGLLSITPTRPLTDVDRQALAEEAARFARFVAKSGSSWEVRIVEPTL